MAAGSGAQGPRLDLWPTSTASPVLRTPGPLSRDRLDVRWRGRPRQVPHASVGIGELRPPDESLTVFDGADLVCERRLYDDVVGDDAARVVAATEGVREAQGHTRAGAPA
jgi:hypothetical protein